MGGSYARLEGFPEKVALGLEQFYLPETGRGPLPATLEGALASLAGKLDTLAGDFTVGLIPTGSEDPHALRRQALGAVRILLEKGLPLSLSRAAAKALELQPGSGQDRARCLGLLEEFLWGRLEGVLEEAGFKVDEVRAVRDGGLVDLPRTVKRVSALHNIRARPEFASIAAAYKRAANILRQAAQSAAGADGDGPPVPSLFGDDAERGHYRHRDRTEGELRLRLQDGEFEESLRIMVGLKPSVDGFFEKVLVMAPVEDVRRNRLRLLGQLVRLLRSVADLSQLQG